MSTINKRLVLIRPGRDLPRRISGGTDRIDSGLLPAQLHTYRRTGVYRDSVPGWAHLCGKCQCFFGVVVYCVLSKVSVLKPPREREKERGGGGGEREGGRVEENQFPELCVDKTCMKAVPTPRAPGKSASQPSSCPAESTTLQIQAHTHLHENGDPIRPRCFAARLVYLDLQEHGGGVGRCGRRHHHHNYNVTNGDYI